MSRKCVILYSGGLDSTTCLAIAKAEGFEPYAMSFSYGQRHNAELQVAKANAQGDGGAGAPGRGVRSSQDGGSALTADIEVPKEGVGIRHPGDIRAGAQYHLPLLCAWMG